MGDKVSQSRNVQNAQHRDPVDGQSHTSHESGRGRTAAAKARADAAEHDVADAGRERAHTHSLTSRARERRDASPSQPRRTRARRARSPTAPMPQDTRITSPLASTHTRRRRNTTAGAYGGTQRTVREAVAVKKVAGVTEPTAATKATTTGPTAHREMPRSCRAARAVARETSFLASPVLHCRR